MLTCLYFWTSWQGRWLGGCFWIISGSMMLRSGLCSWTWFIVKHLGLCFRGGAFQHHDDEIRAKSLDLISKWFGESKCYNLGSWLCVFGPGVGLLLIIVVCTMIWDQTIRFDLRFPDPLLQDSPSYWRWFVWLWLYFCATDAELIGMICLSDAVNDAYIFILRKNLQSLVAVPETSRAAA